MQDVKPFVGQLARLILIIAAILAGIVFAYGSLESFADALLGRHYWVYSVVLLLLALIPIFGIGKLLYEHMSDRIERWES